MHLSKALQPGLHIPLGLRKLSVCLKCKGKTSKSILILNKNHFMKMLIHAVSLFSTDRGWKHARNSIWSSRSYGAVFIIFLTELHPSGWWGPIFPLKTSSLLCKRYVTAPLWDSLPVSSGSALFHWMSQFLIDVFSKALLIQSLPVLVLFREITNCSANPPQSSHCKHMKEPVLRTALRYLGRKI